jgi:UPF0755 protein
MKNLRQRRLIAASILLVVGIVGIAGMLILNRAPSDFPDNTPGRPVNITVAQGESGTKIAFALATAGVIKSEKKFVSTLLANPAGIGIAPGVHNVSSHLTSRVALLQLLDAKRIRNLIIVKDASTSSQVLRLLHQDNELIQRDQISLLALPLANPTHSLEGEIAPDQYSFAPGVSTHDALVAMLSGGLRNLKESGIMHGYKNLIAYQLLTVASLLQIEADPADYSKVASVIYNRLAIGMPLQLNSTVAYAAHLQGHIGLSIAQTKIDSPYNTYQHLGLPPTPICNPTRAALIATINPATSHWLYFITVKPHDTRFTSSFSEFEGWVALYNKNVAAGAFR